MMKRMRTRQVVVFCAAALTVGSAAAEEKAASYGWEEPAEDGDAMKAQWAPKGERAWMITAEVVPHRESGDDVRDVAYFPDGDDVLVGYSSGLVVRWNLSRGEKVWSAKPVKEVGALAVSPVGDVVAVWKGSAPSGETDFAIHVLDAKSGTLVKKLVRKSFSRGCSDNYLVASKAEFDSRGGLVVLYFNESLANSGDCMPMKDRTIAKWNVRAEKVAWHYVIPIPNCVDSGADFCGLPIPAFRLSPDGRTVAGGYCDGSVFFLSAASGKAVSRKACPEALDRRIYQKYDTFSGSPRSFAWAPDGKRVFLAYGPQSSSWMHLMRYELPKVSKPGRVTMLGRVSGAGPDVAVTPDGRTLVVALGDLFFYDVEGGKITYRSRGGTFAVNPVRREVVTRSANGLFVHHERPVVTMKAGAWTKTGLFVRAGQSLHVQAKGSFQIGYGADRLDSPFEDVASGPAFRGNDLYIPEKGGELLVNLKAEGDVTIAGGMTEGEFNDFGALRATLRKWKE
ncbi:MAG: WD40 repeat domain-containing protein [Deltaproteobacteria bacterium]|nr:WD40 repeat domain-containing protein [Deltaproteobacteria bacterium]